MALALTEPVPELEAVELLVPVFVGLPLRVWLLLVEKEPLWLALLVGLRLGVTAGLGVPEAELP